MPSGPWGACEPCSRGTVSRARPMRSIREPDSGLLSINTATVRKQWALPEIIAGCARHGIRRLSPWRDQVAATGLKETAQRLRDAGMALSCYCRGGMFSAADRACVNTMAHANDLCDELAPGANGGLGIAVDVYHVWWDPDLHAEIERAGGHPGRLLAFHICDWLVPTVDLLLDRGMMGDGV